MKSQLFFFMFFAIIISVHVTDIVPCFVAVEHSPIGQDPTAYWEITCEQAGKEIKE